MAPTFRMTLRWKARVSRPLSAQEIGIRIRGCQRGENVTWMPPAAGSGDGIPSRGITQIVAELSQPRGYTAQSRDTISSILGTSDPQAIGNFMRANGLRSSTVYAGQDYVIPGAMSAVGDNSALGQNALNIDNSRLKGRR